MTQATSGGPTPLSTPLVPMLISVGDGVQVTLDFTPYDTAQTLGSTSTVQPLLKYDGNTSSVSRPFLFRTSLLAGNTNESFLSLTHWSSAATAVDMSGADTSGSNFYEINVFVVAYGLSPTLQAIYSPPVPWGIIRSPN